MVDFEAYSQPPLFNFIRIKHINYMMHNQQKNASNEIREKKRDEKRGQVLNSGPACA